MKHGDTAWASTLGDGDAVTMICVYVMTSQHLLTLGRERRTVEPSASLPGSWAWTGSLVLVEIVGERLEVGIGVQGPFLQDSLGLWDGWRLKLSHLGDGSASRAASTGAITACGEMNKVVNQPRAADCYPRPGSTDVIHFKIRIGFFQIPIQLTLIEPLVCGQHHANTILCCSDSAWLKLRSVDLGSKILSSNSRGL